MKKAFYYPFVYIILLFASCKSSEQTTESNTDPQTCYIYLNSKLTNNITDLALIYQGGIKRLDWNKEQLQPHVSWINPSSQKEEWLFDGFLFLEFRDFRGNIFANGYGGEPASKEVLDWYLDRIFEKNLSVDALDQVIGETINRIGKPQKMRQVILTIPEPIRGYKNWGVLNGKKLDFDIEEDRLAAAQYFIDKLLERWNKGNFKNITLAGFYWVAEEVHNENKSLVMNTKEYIHKKNKKFYWIPWWKSPGSPSWKDCFDVAYQQPNHFFNKSVPDSRLDEACEFACEHNMGLEMEWDVRVWTDKAAFLPRMNAYLDYFEKHEVIKNAAIAHYMDGEGLYAMTKNLSDPDVLKVYIRYCNILVKRQKTK